MDAARAPSSSPPAAFPLERKGARTGAVTLAYLVIAIVFTWPLAPGLTRDVPSDLGDSLLNIWILSWEAEQLTRLLTGDFAVLATWFDGNIFYPVPNALAYSELLIAQTLQVLPLYLITHNPILCYNVLFLSTYVLSGLGAYLLVRELTGDVRAAFVAGLLFAFIPYRIPQAAHLQVLSSQWMPFTLLGFTRYLNTGRRRALAGASIALLLQSLSCGYFLIYFPPFAAGYVLWELARRGALRDRRVWAELSVAAVLIALALTPFLIPYARVQSTVQLSRRLEEIRLYSADVYAYLTAFPTQRFWGPRLALMPRAEGELFMGGVATLLGLAGASLFLRRAWRAGHHIDEPRIALSTALGTASLLLLTLIMVTLFTRRVSIDLGVLPVRVSEIGRPLIWLIAAFTLLLLSSRRAVARVRAGFTAEGFFLLSIVIAWWLSLGPSPQSLGRPLDLPAPYNLLYLLPGVDGVRVPARLAMIVALMLAVAAGYVIARLPRNRAGSIIAWTLVLGFLFEAPADPFSVNGVAATAGHEVPEARIHPPGRGPAVYDAVAALEGHTALLELPIGDTTWDVRAVYYASTHWRPLINGYSGFFPPHYGSLVARLLDPDRDPAAAWQAVVDSGASHVLLHTRAYRQAEVEQIRRWLAARGARQVFGAEGDLLFDVRRQ
jgi:hypothetical protein